MKRMKLHVITRAKKAMGPFHRHRRDLDPGRYRHRLLYSGFGLESKNSSTGNRPQVMGPQQPNKLMYDFREIIVQFFSQKGREKGYPFKETFHVRICCGTA